MLSALRSGALRSISQGKQSVQALAVVPTRNASAAVDPDREYNIWGNPIPTKEERIATWDYVNSVYFGPERDMKNYPNPTQPDYSPPVRLGVVPATWFDAFYSKTGVSGPYVFLGGLALWTTSKEHNPIDHYFWEFPVFWTMCYMINSHPKMGPALKAKMIVPPLKKDRYINWERPMREMAQSELDNLSHLERLVEECETADHVKLCQQEGVQLQLESAYRQRLNHVYTEVKKRMDYESEKINVQKQFEQDHMVNWIVSSVQKSITPQQEKDAIKSCISSLKQLASKQAA